MIRAILALIAVSTLVVVLLFLTLESRAVNETYYLEYAERTRLVDEIRNDLGLVTSGAESAFAQGRDTPNQVSAALDRLAENRVALQGQMTRVPADVASAISALDTALAGIQRAGRAFVEELDAFSASIRVVQEDSPAVIRVLRDLDLAAQSRELFSFTLDLMGYATGQNDQTPEALSERLASFSGDDSVPAQVSSLAEEFAAAAVAVIDRRSSAAAALQSLRESVATDRLVALDNAVGADYRETNSRAERARLLLSLCALVLVAGVGFVLYRLQSSYRALNRSNEELAAINESLEERVSERTAELSSAYDELKDSQVQLVQAEKMSSLGELVAGISHEINTPLWYLINNATTVKERLQLVSEFTGTADTMIEALCAGEDTRKTLSAGLTRMRRMLAEGLKDDIEEADDLINDSIEGLEELTELAQSLKDFSRLDRAHSGQFDVNEGIEKTLLIARNKLKEKVEIHKDLGEVPVITCAPSQINQVFLNLITNAADAIEDRGEIRIRTWREDDTVCIRIADTGCGIPEQLLERIRDPFFTTKEVGKGTGLGMSIVDRIIGSHNGRLDIESVVGQGTTMTVRLPIDSRLAPTTRDEHADSDSDIEVADDEVVLASGEAAAMDEAEAARA